MVKDPKAGDKVRVSLCARMSGLVDNLDPRDTLTVVSTEVEDGQVYVTVSEYDTAINSRYLMAVSSL